MGQFSDPNPYEAPVVAELVKPKRPWWGCSIFTVVWLVLIGLVLMQFTLMPFLRWISTH